MPMPRHYGGHRGGPPPHGHHGRSMGGPHGGFGGRRGGPMPPPHHGRPPMGAPRQGFGGYRGGPMPPPPPMPPRRTYGGCLGMFLTFLVGVMILGTLISLVF